MKFCLTLGELMSFCLVCILWDVSKLLINLLLIYAVAVYLLLSTHNNNMLEFLTPYLDNPYFQIFSAVVVLFSAIAAATPTPKEGTWQAKAYKVIDWLALNVGKAKDTNPPATPVAPTTTTANTSK